LVTIDHLDRIVGVTIPPMMPYHDGSLKRRQTQPPPLTLRHFLVPSGVE
jgi:hypothetical protein